MDRTDIIYLPAQSSVVVAPRAPVVRPVGQAWHASLGVPVVPPADQVPMAHMAHNVPPEPGAQGSVYKAGTRGADGGLRLCRAGFHLSGGQTREIESLSKRKPCGLCLFGRQLPHAPCGRYCRHSILECRAGQTNAGARNKAEPGKEPKVCSPSGAMHMDAEMAPAAVVFPPARRGCASARASAECGVRLRVGPGQSTRPFHGFQPLTRQTHKRISVNDRHGIAARHGTAWQAWLQQQPGPS